MIGAVHLTKLKEDRWGVMTLSFSVIPASVDMILLFRRHRERGVGDKGSDPFYSL